MTVLPNDPGVVVIGCLLRDPGEGPWGRGAPHVPSLPPRPHADCDDCGGAGWIVFPDPFLGGTLDARCPTCGDV